MLVDAERDSVFRSDVSRSIVGVTTSRRNPEWGNLWPYERFFGAREHNVVVKNSSQSEG